MTRDKIEGMQTQSQNGENPLQTQYAELMAPPDRKFESLNRTGSGTNNLPDLTIPGSGIDISKQADTPFRFIEAQFPENRGKIPEKSQYTLAKEEAAQRMRDGTDVFHRIKEAGKIEKPSEHVVKKGETYWSVAHQLTSKNVERPTAGDVKFMVKKLAAYNGKTEVEAANIKPGDIIKIPPDLKRF